MLAIVLMGVSVVIAQAGGAAGNAGSLLKAKKFSDACDAYEAVLRVTPADREARDGEVLASEQLALQERAEGKFDEALKALLQATSYVPDSFKLLYDLGILEDEMGLYLDADRSLTKLEAMQGKGETPEVLYAAGRVKLDLGQLDSAQEKMTSYLKIKPYDASAHFGLGRVYRMKLDYGNAEDEFRKSIQLQPQQTEGYYELGDAQLQSGDLPGASADFDKVLQRNPKHGGALVGMGMVAYQRKEYSKAVEVLRKATAAEPMYRPGHYYLGLALARLGQPDESKAELATAHKLEEEDKKRAANRLVLPTE